MIRPGVRSILVEGLRAEGKIGQILRCLFIHAQIWLTCSQSHVCDAASLLLRPLQLALSASAWRASCCLLIVLVAGEYPTAK